MGGYQRYASFITVLQEHPNSVNTTKKRDSCLVFAGCGKVVLSDGFSSVRRDRLLRSP